MTGKSEEDRMTDLLLDPAIRSWVFVPIIIIVFLFGIIRHYAYLLLVNKKKGDLQNVKDSHYLAKARLLRENGRILPPQGFAMRKYFLNDEEHGYMLKRVAKQSSQPNPALDPSMMTDMLKALGSGRVIRQSLRLGETRRLVPVSPTKIDSAGIYGFRKSGKSWIWGVANFPIGARIRACDTSIASSRRDKTIGTGLADKDRFCRDLWLPGFGQILEMAYREI
ncbi:integral membrane protein DUF106 domain-containing protein [Ditylenchus destructor]|uniref:ER membrane protein complex subunit 3 n=1 Tax=Ditylenchus destructor TaxID=166010 RepID=A0AAD4N318_9BILA|nr:integral membrane protein DUF106 domain-containing protein [Ditylenchus destructor]